MKSIMLALFFTVIIFSQQNNPIPKDTLIYINGDKMIGEVSIIKANTIDFIKSEEDITYEIMKSAVSKIILKNGKILEFNIIEPQRIQDVSTDNKPNSNSDKSTSDYGIYGFIISFNAGYGLLNMGKVNEDLKDSENIFSKAGAVTNAPDEILGGVYVEGNLKYRFSNIAIGASANYIFSSGEFSYSDPSGSFEESYDVNTIELMGLLEIIMGSSNSPVNFFVQLSAGIGLASAEHLASFQIFNSPSDNIKVKNELSGQYFSGKIKTGIYINFNKALLELSGGYRLANAEEIKGTLTQNGVSYQNMPVRDINGNGIEFDYSGVFFSAGLSFVL